MFTAELFTIAKMWKQTKLLWTNKWIKKKQHIHKTKFNSAFKRDRNSKIFDHMDKH